MIKRYHEAPKQIFNQVQHYTDGDYALVHLFETDAEYFQMFKDAVEAGRDVILDNSIFELGTSFNHERYAHWINLLKPTWYIVPDVWKDGQATAKMFHEFFRNHPRKTLHGKVIVVAQGYTLEEVAECYRSIAPYCDMVAFNFDFSSYCVPSVGIPKRLQMSLGRVRMLTDLLNAGVIDPTKPHHLLGCGVPQEICWYPKRWKWVRSMDTCHPVMEGMHWNKYSPDLPGMVHKTPDKMCDNMEVLVDNGRWLCIEHNLKEMSKWEELRP